VIVTSLELAPNRVELAHLLVPNTEALAALNNPQFPPALAEISDLQVAAHSVGLDVTVLNASDESEIDSAFSVLSRNKVGALIITTDPLLLGKREQIVQLAARHKIPTIYFSAISSMLAA
jgi:putative ABC transport system substrate-binding protein